MRQKAENLRDAEPFHSVLGFFGVLYADSLQLRLCVFRRQYSSCLAAEGHTGSRASLKPSGSLKASRASLKSPSPAFHRDEPSPTFSTHRSSRQSGRVLNT